MPIEVIENMVFEDSFLLLLATVPAHLDGATERLLYESSASFHLSNVPGTRSPRRAALQTNRK